MKPLPLSVSLGFACFALVFCAASASNAATLVVEPDDYADGATLTTVSPYVTLNTTLADNQIVPLFAVTAENDNTVSNFAPTGIRVFAHTGIPFFNDVRRLRTDFAGTTSQVSIAFGGGSSLSTTIGRLEVYGTDGTLLEFDRSEPRLAQQFETLSVTRPISDIAYAIAYGEGSTFGRFDALVFATPVPEPGAGVAGIALLGLLARRRSH